MICGEQQNVFPWRMHHCLPLKERDIRGTSLTHNYCFCIQVLVKVFFTNESASLIGLLTVFKYNSGGLWPWSVKTAFSRCLGRSE